MPCIAPWSPYLERLPLPSAGKVSLTAAFADLIKVRHDFERHEIAEIFAAPEDDGENDACRDIVRLDAELLAMQMLHGRITSFARPINGGDAVTLAASIWEIDDPLPRFAAGALNLKHLFDPSSEPTHRIFIDNQEFARWLACQHPAGPVSARELHFALDPKARAARTLSQAEGGYDLTEADAAITAEPGGEPMPETNDAVLIPIAEVEQMTAICHSTIYDRMGKGEFPMRIKIGGASRWLRTEVLDWIREQAVLRDR